MKKVTKGPLVMEVLNIPGVYKSLERLANLLGKIQKALGEYLERERASFPRFVITLCGISLGWAQILSCETVTKGEQKQVCSCKEDNLAGSFSFTKETHLLDFTLQ